jgi:predicted RNase H-like HicB family nuclease
MSVTVRTFAVLIEWDRAARSWVTYVPGLGGLSTFGPSREAALEATREAILGYLEAAEKEHITVPDPPPAEVVQLKVAV